MLKHTPILICTLVFLCSCTSHVFRPEGPCDIYEKGGTPCVSAHSTTRLLNSKYDGPLYQIMRESDGAVLDIGIIDGGYADAAQQDRFSRGTISYITVIYDQSGHENHLYQAAPGTFKGPAKGEFNTLPIADMAPATLNGHKVYGVYIMPGMGFRNNDATDLAINDEPEGIYYVVDGTHYDNGCCFDYGNSSTNGKAVGTGTMETTYYGTSTNWGSGLGDGPWIMSDMEGGLFSGWNAKKNDVPTIDSWRFVSVFVNGGGGNQWDLRGCDATQEKVITYYSGIRPGSPESDSYYPMNKKGGLLLGNGGDNGNGSAGTFYEGVMTVGYPSDETINAVQLNIAAAKYAEQPVWMSRLTSFSADKPQNLTVTFRNTTGHPVEDVAFDINLPEGWTSKLVSSTISAEQSLSDGSLAAAEFSIVPVGHSVAGGFLEASVRYNGGSESLQQRVRCVPPVKINEVGISGGQFIELYNPSFEPVDISGYRVEVTRSGWAPVTAAVLPSGTSIPANGFLVLRPTTEAMVADTLPLTTIFSPVSTGPRISIAPGSTSVPVTNVRGFVEGRKMGIDLGGKYEEVTITAVGTSATQTVLSEAAKAGQTVLQVEATAALADGMEITISTGQRKEVVKVKKVLKVSEAPVRRMFGRPAVPHEPGTIEIDRPLVYDQMKGVDISALGTGISFTPALKYAHSSGDALWLLDGAGGFNASATDGAHYGYTLSPSAGAVALFSDDTVVDAIVYGSKQSNSSANGTITRPDLATLEGEQSQGGCIAVVPMVPRFPMNAPIAPSSLIRFPDGADADYLCDDFHDTDVPTPGALNQKKKIQ